MQKLTIASSQEETKLSTTAGSPAHWQQQNNNSQPQYTPKPDTNLDDT